MFNVQKDWKNLKKHYEYFKVEISKKDNTSQRLCKTFNLSNTE